MRIICFGDSLTFGYQVSRDEKWHVIVEKMTGIQMINRGVSGDTTEGMINRIQKQVFAAKPDGVILMGGYNDIFFNCAWEQAALNMITMVEQSRAHGLLVVVAIPPPISLPVTFKEGGAPVDFEKSAVMIESYCQWLRAFTASEQIPTLDFTVLIDWTDQRFISGWNSSKSGWSQADG